MRSNLLTFDHLGSREAQKWRDQRRQSLWVKETHERLHLRNDIHIRVYVHVGKYSPAECMALLA